MRGLDWRALRGSMVLAAFAVTIGVAVTGAALRFHAEASRGYDREKARLEAVRSRYRTIDEQKRQIETWLPAYRSLESAGIIGEERRLEWIETLRAAAARAGLPSLRYRMEPRTAYEAGPGLGTGDHGAFSTVVRIEATIPTNDTFLPSCLSFSSGQGHVVNRLRSRFNCCTGWLLT